MIHLQYYKINIRIESSISDFIEFIAHYFSEQVSYKIDDESAVIVRFKKVNKEGYDNFILNFKKKDNVSQLSRSIFCNDSSVLLTDLSHFPGLLLVFSIHKDKLEISGYYYNQESIKKTLSRLFYNKNKNLELFLYLKYYLILFPVIWYYEYVLGKYLFHTSAVLYKGSPILFSGLGGVGKSTLVISLLENPDFQFISDNLVVYGNDELIAINEAIALDETSLLLCKNVRNHLYALNMPMSHGREYFRIKDSIVSSGRVNKIFFIKFSGITEITKLDQEQAKEKCELINSIAKEIVEYRSIASALNLSLGNQFSSVRKSSLKNLIENTECFELNIKPGDELKKAYILLLDILG